jgi:hypothetical protein
MMSTPLGHIKSNPGLYYGSHACRAGMHSRIPCLILRDHTMQLIDS